MAMAIIGMIGVVFAAVLVNVFQSSNKVNVVSQIKDNGQAVMDRIDKQLQSANHLVCISSDGKILVVKSASADLTKGFVRYRFYPQTVNTNGYIALDYPTTTNPNDVTADPDSPTSFCNLSGTQVSPIPLTNFNDVQNGLSLDVDRVLDASNPTPCQRVFTRQVNLGGFQDQVRVCFRAYRGAKAASAFDQSVPPNGILFQTAVQLR